MCFFVRKKHTGYSTCDKRVNVLLPSFRHSPLAVHVAGRRAAEGPGGDWGLAPARSHQTRVSIHFLPGAHAVRALRRGPAEAPDAALQAPEERVELRLRRDTQPFVL